MWFLHGTVQIFHQCIMTQTLWRGNLYSPSASRYWSLSHCLYWFTTKITCNRHAGVEQSDNRSLSAGVKILFFTNSRDSYSAVAMCLHYLWSFFRTFCASKDKEDFVQKFLFISRHHQVCPALVYDLKTNDRHDCRLLLCKGYWLIRLPVGLNNHKAMIENM